MTTLRNAIARGNAVLGVLLLWAFALGASWANACLLQHRATHDHVSSDVASAVAQAPGISADHVMMIAAHGDAPEFQNAPCLKVCDEESQSMVKKHATFDLTDPALALPVAVAWTGQMTFLSALAFRRKALLPSTGPPLRIWYSRLVL